MLHLDPRGEPYRIRCWLMKICGYLKNKIEEAGLYDDLNSENEALIVSERQPRQPENGNRRKLF